MSGHVHSFGNMFSVFYFRDHDLSFPGILQDVTNSTRIFLKLFESFLDFNENNQHLLIIRFNFYFFLFILWASSSFLFSLDICKSKDLSIICKLCFIKKKNPSSRPFVKHSVMLIQRQVCWWFIIQKYSFLLPALKKWIISSYCCCCC